LGRATASLFADEGASLVLVDQDENGLAELRAKVGSRGGAAQVVAGDVGTAATATESVEKAMSSFGRVDVLFNNAGIVPSGATTILDTSEADWDKVMNVNAKSVYLFSRAALPAMVEARQGVIVNTASISGVHVTAQRSAYSVSKAAVISLTRSIAIDYAPFGIRCNCICPGMMQSVMAEARSLLSAAELGELTARRAAMVPLGRAGRYSEVARAVLFLAGSDSSFVTGDVMIADGGFTMRGGITLNTDYLSAVSSPGRA
jgi:NAD(P)-dependent dehydrogenase (short-subunit alcohol dehydrogenase family)